MKTTRLRGIGALLVVATLALPARAGAAGFGIYETSTRALGLGGAYTGLADTPAAIFFNPAGLATQTGLSLEVNLALIMPNFTFDTTLPGTADPITLEGKANLFMIPSLYASYRVHDRVALGFGTYSPFGLGVEWPDTFNHNGAEVPWWGRSTIKKIEVQTLYLNFTAAVKLHDRIYLGGGFVVGFGSVYLKRAVMASADLKDDIDIELSGDDVSFGGTAGLLVKVIPGLLNVGVSYKSAMKFNFEGNAAFTQNGSPNIPQALRSTLIDGKVVAPITLPHTISFGVTAFPMERLILGINVDIVTWSSYEKLSVEFPDNPKLSSSDAKNWTNTFQLRIGAEYQVLEKNLPVRLGFVYDQSPIPDDTVGPELPGTDRYWIALGVGYKLFGIQADLAYQLLITGNDPTGKDVVIPGSRAATAHVVSLGLSYNFAI
ncbi:MAG: outer membrane protein transport protein [Deltaproteobacteria bacterium]|nr:outer membrane protein transport protein [Deltaproteobacteria bacterium]